MAQDPLLSRRNCIRPAEDRDEPSEAASELLNRDIKTYGWQARARMARVRAKRQTTIWIFHPGGETHSPLSPSPAPPKILDSRLEFYTSGTGQFYIPGPTLGIDPSSGPAFSLGANPGDPLPSHPCLKTSDCPSRDAHPWREGHTVVPRAI